MEATLTPPVQHLVVFVIVAGKVRTKEKKKENFDTTGEHLKIRKNSELEHHVFARCKNQGSSREFRNPCMAVATL